VTGGVIGGFEQVTEASEAPSPSASSRASWPASAPPSREASVRASWPTSDPGASRAASAATPPSSLQAMRKSSVEIKTIARRTPCDLQSSSERGAQRCEPGTELEQTPLGAEPPPLPGGVRLGLNEDLERPSATGLDSSTGVSARAGAPPSSHGPRRARSRRRRSHPARGLGSSRHRRERPQPYASQSESTTRIVNATRARRGCCLRSCPRCAPPTSGRARPPRSRRRGRRR